MTSTINPDEIGKFDAVADAWWQPTGSFAPLHAMNPCRLSYIMDTLMTHGLAKEMPHNQITLKGRTILDVGCGGGLLCEPFARLGATVTGLDASEKAIQVAQAHAREQDLAIAYHCQDVSTFEAPPFDVVCALEIMEHVPDPQAFLHHLLNHLKPGGLLFISTLDRTWLSYLQGIVLAEYVLRWVPRGTHNWQAFIRPSELYHMGQKVGGTLIDIKGMTFDPMKKTWSLAPTPKTNYIATMKKNP